MSTKRKGADLNRNTSKSRSLRNRRSERTEEQIQQQNTNARVRMAQLRQEERRTNDQQRQQIHRAFTSDSFLRLAFQYEPDIEYYAHSKVVIQNQRPSLSYSGSLLPMPNEPHTFLQIYFMGGEDSGSALANRVNARCDYNNLDSFYARRIVSELDALLNEHNELLKILKSHMHKLQSDNHAIVINPDKTPAGEHICRFNAPVVDDVAGIMVAIVQVHEKL
ncbi:Hypothetical protein CINCED_3A003556 [Cinara cedri]|uniref:Helitron helicase-like domain-containing protein n=1 Tax=Cinara cedri TaxID=506608 RepID=A0A5E4NBV0_9HEMI|nr:Hypothetical protein CINCED_3A003556 [Cinara cedri]